MHQEATFPGGKLDAKRSVQLPTGLPGWTSSST